MSTKTETTNREETNATKTQDERYVVPNTNIYETDNEYVLTSEMPGVSKENLNVVIDNKVLEITGHLDKELKEHEPSFCEFSFSNYYRRFRIGTEIDVEGVKAVIQNGILTMTLPKAQAARPRKIEISSN